jgi:hypothetical protein
VAVDGLIVPSPSEVIKTMFAPPPNVFPLTSTGASPQVLPVVLLNATFGLFLHLPHDSIEISSRRRTHAYLAIFLEIAINLFRNGKTIFITFLRIGGSTIHK